MEKILIDNMISSLSITLSGVLSENIQYFFNNLKNKKLSEANKHIYINMYFKQLSSINIQELKNEINETIQGIKSHNVVINGLIINEKSNEEILKILNDNVYMIIKLYCNYLSLQINYEDDVDYFFLLLNGIYKILSQELSNNIDHVFNFDKNVLNIRYISKCINNSIVLSLKNMIPYHSFKNKLEKSQLLICDDPKLNQLQLISNKKNENVLDDDEKISIASLSSIKKAQTEINLSSGKKKFDDIFSDKN